MGCELVHEEISEAIIGAAMAVLAWKCIVR
jgi:hypothetical protein